MKKALTNRSRWLLTASLATVLVAVGLSGCTSGAPTSAATDGIQGISVSSQQRGIWVTGEGKVSAVPDVVTLRLGIEAQDSSVALAQAAASQAMDGVMAALTENGIAKEDIQTVYFNIHAVTRWDREDEQEEVIGYRVSNIVSAKIRDMERIGGIIDAVAAAGGDLTRVDGIDFGVDDPTGHYEDAREAAMADAEAKAEQLAKLAGVRLGKATYISEGGSRPPIPIYASGVALAKAAADTETQISLGEIEIGLTIQVAYAIVD